MKMAIQLLACLCEGCLSNAASSGADRVACRASTTTPQRWQQAQGGIPPWLLAASKSGAQVPAAILSCCYLRTHNHNIISTSL